MYKAILWDNDGILVETEKWYYKATKKVMANENFDLSFDLYRKTFLENNKGAWHFLDNNDEDYIINLRNKRNKLYSEYLFSEKLFTVDLNDLLSSLGKKYTMGIVTSSKKHHFDIIHQRGNILHYFEFIVASGDYSHSKPHPEPYLIGIQKSGYKASECIAIEDSERGVAAAKKANLYCIAVPNEMTKDSDFSKADIVATEIQQVEEIINNL